MIEHEAWIGPGYRCGGLMLWGFSHHRELEEPDGPSFTIDTIKELALTDKHWFFTRLRTICGGVEPAAFWNGIAFANTLPNAVVEDIYSSGSTAAREAVKPRVRRIIEDLHPSKVILFSRKAWELWPELDGSHAEPAQALTPTGIATWGSYRTTAHFETLAYNLPHPQGQRIANLAAEVAAIRAHSIG